MGHSRAAADHKPGLFCPTRVTFWDARTTLAGVDGTAQVQACFTPTGGGTAVCNADAKAPTVTLDEVNAGVWQRAPTSRLAAPISSPAT